jgi:hypothetical protein
MSQRKADMTLAMAIDLCVEREFPQMEVSARTGLKLAAMYRCGISDQVVMVAAVEGAEFMDFERMLIAAERLGHKTRHEPILDLVEEGARKLVGMVEGVMRQ